MSRPRSPLSRCSICTGAHDREECPSRAPRASERPVHSANHYCGMCRVSYTPGTPCGCVVERATVEVPAFTMSALISGEVPL